MNRIIGKRTDEIESSEEMGEKQRAINGQRQGKNGRVKKKDQSHINPIASFPPSNNLNLSSNPPLPCPTFSSAHLKVLRPS